jgi:hypothetical protein
MTCFSEHHMTDNNLSHVSIDSYPAHLILLDFIILIILGKEYILHALLSVKNMATELYISPATF